jgi:hypothetical protein
MATLVIASTYTNGSNFTANPQCQTFAGADCAGALNTVSLVMDSTDASFNLTMTLQGVTGSQPDGVVKATATVVSTGTLSSSAAPVTFTFPSPFTIVSGTSYSIVVTCDSGTSNTHYYWTNTAPYANGQYGQGSWTMFPGIDSTMTLNPSNPPVARRMSVFQAVKRASFY